MPSTVRNIQNLLENALKAFNGQTNANGQWTTKILPNGHIVAPGLISWVCPSTAILIGMSLTVGFIKPETVYAPIKLVTFSIKPHMTPGTGL